MDELVAARNQPVTGRNGVACESAHGAQAVGEAWFGTTQSA
ncbi:MAG: hypothetical protein Q8N96_10655 [Methylovulum sp.]|nr:hypothetical protein [Methylovulum sp.]